MNLSPEDKKIRQREFPGIRRHHATRLPQGLDRGGRRRRRRGPALGGYYFGYKKIDNPLRVGVIGTGDEGNVLIGALNPDYIDLVAVPQHPALQRAPRVFTATGIRPAPMKPAPAC